MSQTNSLAPIDFRRGLSFNVGKDNFLYLLDVLLDPCVLAISLWGVAIYVEGKITAPYLLLTLIVFSLSIPGTSRLALSPFNTCRDVLFSWITLAGLLFFFGYATRYLRLFSEDAITMWLWVAPASQMSAQLLFKAAAPRLVRLMGLPRRAVIVGVSAQGITLARRMAVSPYVDIRVLGFFDDRDKDRHAIPETFSLLGKTRELAAYVKSNRVELIYCCLPMTSQPRILHLLDDLRDTTASIYFVPDVFLTDLIQSRVDSICDMPVVSICETPFTGMNGFAKRASDIALASVILLLVSPLLLLTAIGVKLSSPGPVIFKQRRYGLNGEEILVYKFRSMKVCEDTGTIQQAQKSDPRVTPFGAFLRKSSLDELPQFINVLQGRMSIVGPRPHAVAHNELYRKLIKGYMVRHKVRPGITGWAQVNGFRGETELLEKMQARIDYDLDYLRNWSLRLDLYIVAKTLKVVFSHDNAY